MRGTRFEPEQDGPGMRPTPAVSPLAVEALRTSRPFRACDLQGSNRLLLFAYFLTTFEKSLMRGTRFERADSYETAS